MKEMIGKREVLRRFRKQWALELRWHWVADCCKGGIRPPEMHTRRQWTAVCVGSLAAWNGWRRLEVEAVEISDELGVVGKIPWHQTMHAGIGKGAQPAWSRCLPETAASESIAASVWRAHRTKVDVSGGGVEHRLKSVALGCGKPS